jgi:hypothetical protein
MDRIERDPTSSKAADIVIPVWNEAHVLERSVATVLDFLGEHFASEFGSQKSMAMSGTFT